MHGLADGDRRAPTQSLAGFPAGTGGCETSHAKVDTKTDMLKESCYGTRHLRTKQRMARGL